MKILIVASEIAPFAKTGGLADMTSALPKALKDLGHDVRLIMPFYKCVETTGKHAIRKGRKSIEVPINGSLKKGFLRTATLINIPLYLIENREYFGRDFLYGAPAGDYPDNPQRFAFFCRGVLQLLKRMDYRPDVIHCHDWQTSLIPIIMKHELKEDPFFMRTATVFTIHNLSYQGLFCPELLGDIGLGPSYQTTERLEFFGKCNPLKGGILSADVVNTVSEAYRREILTPEHGCGLDGVLLQRQEDLYGIINGIDTGVWSPVFDRALVKNYTSSSVSGKNANKKDVQKLFGLEPKTDVPLLAMVSRLSEQKGIDLLLEILPRLAQEKVQFILLGEGDERYVGLLNEVRDKLPPNISIRFGYEADIAHKIYAGSDILLMPSRFEPCGLNQLIGLNYGAIPVARRVGGLSDTVSDIAEQPKEGNGFLFDDYSADAFLHTISRAIAAYHDREEWRRLVRRGMQLDFTWKRSAKRYEELYRRGLDKKRSSQ